MQSPLSQTLAISVPDTQSHKCRPSNDSIAGHCRVLCHRLTISAQQLVASMMQTLHVSQRVALMHTIQAAAMLASAYRSQGCTYAEHTRSSNASKHSSTALICCIASLALWKRPCSFAQSETHLISMFCICRKTRLTRSTDACNSSTGGNFEAGEVPALA